MEMKQVAEVLRCDGFNQFLDQGYGSELDFWDSLSLLVDFIKKYRIRLRNEVKLRPPLPFLRKSYINILHA